MRHKWLFWLTALIATNLGWVIGVVSAQSHEEPEAPVVGENIPYILDYDDLGVCRVQRESLRADLWKCNEGKRLIFTLDERRAECERLGVPMGMLPIECYIWEGTDDD